MALTSLIEYVQALDTSATDGSGKTGLAFGDITAKYLKQGGTLTSLTTETITTLGTYQAPTSNAHIRIKELANTDPTKGIYEVHFHDDQVASAGKRLRAFFSATGARFIPLGLDLLLNDVKSLNESTQSLTDLKDLADTGYDPVTHSIVLVQTTTTNTDMRGTNGAYTGTPPTASDISTQVNSDLTTAHGSGSYQTATGFAVAGDAMALTSDERTSLAAVIWNSLTSGFLTAGSIGKRIVDYLTGDAYARIGAPVGASMSADIAAVKGDTAAIKLITDEITFTVAGAVNVNVTSWLGFVVEVDAQNYPLIGTVNTRANYSLTSAYDAAKTAAQSDTALSNLVWTDAKAAYLDAAISSASAPTAADVADAVCDELLADHMIAGSVARGIASAGAAGDPLSSPVPGSYTVGQAGYALALIGTGNTFAPVVGRIGATGEVVDSDTIVAYHFGPVEVNPLVVLDSNNDPVDMSVYSGNLAFIVFSVDETGVETNIVRLSGGNVVVGGDDNNEITLSGTTALTATVGRFRYALRVTTTNNKLVRLQGDFIVKACANTA